MARGPSNARGLKRSFVTEQLIKDIRSRIESGELRPGDSLISEKDFCARYKISLVSVRRALQELQEAGLIEKRWGKGNFVANGAGESEFVGVIVPNLSNPVFIEFLEEITQQVTHHDHQVVLGNAGNDAKREAALVEDFAARGIGKVLRFPNVLSREKAIRERLSSLGINVVILNDFWTDLPCRQVRVDEAHGAMLAMNHLLERRHRRIAYLDYAPEVRRAVFNVYREALRDVGAYNEDYVCLRTGGILKEGVDFLLKHRGVVTACLTPYDSFSVFFSETLVGQFGYGIPDDLAIVGFDDIADASRPSVSLTTIRQPKAEIVEKALGLLQTPFDDNASVLVQVKPDLIVRRSTLGTDAPEETEETEATHERIETMAITS